MPKRSLIGSLFLVSLFCFTFSASAQSPGGSRSTPGYWSQGKWIGYLPAHLKGANQAPGASAFGPGAAAPGVPAAQGSPKRQPVDAASYDESISMGETVPFVEDLAGPDAMSVVPPDMTAACGGCGECDACYVGAPCMPTGCQPCFWTSRLWGEAEYLGWWTSGMRLPALVTTSPDGTPQAEAGVLDQPGTDVLFGQDSVNRDGRSGGRYTLGLFLDPCGYRGVEVTYFNLGEASDGFSASNDDFAILARPFFNVQTGEEDAALIAFPDVVSGTVSAVATTQLEGTEILFRRSFSQSCLTEVDLLLGYRWMELEDGLRVRSSTLALSGPAAGTTIDLFDNFQTRNDFHGLEVGFNTRRQLFPCWSLELLGKLAIGNTRSVAMINGQTTTTTVDGAATVNSGGLLAQSTNIGLYERESLATVTELGATLHRQVSCRTDLSFGYTFLYWSDVARAGNQIDRDVNLSQVPPGPLVGATRPAFAFQTTDFWAQGLRFGLTYSY